MVAMMRAAARADMWPLADGMQALRISRVNQTDSV